jgi:hypothetical protein
VAEHKHCPCTFYDPGTACRLIYLCCHCQGRKRCPLEEQSSPTKE